MFKAEATSPTPSLFGDDFNEEVLKRVKKRLRKSHDMFKSIRVTASYENKQLNFEFTRNNNKQITSGQRETINKHFGPILKEVIREVQAEMSG